MGQDFKIFSRNNDGFYLVQDREVSRISPEFLAQVLLDDKTFTGSLITESHRLGKEDTHNFGHAESNVYHGYLTQHCLIRGCIFSFEGQN